MVPANVLTTIVSYVVSQASGILEHSNDVSPVNWTLINPDAWWGPVEKQANPDTGIYSANITFDDEMIADLRKRLNNHRSMVKPLEGTAFEYGFNHDQIEGWTKYWAEKYDFKAREENFNQFPLFKTNIQGLDIFFVKVSPNTNKEKVPLLLLHGWPGSIKEFWDAIPLLTNPDNNKDFAVEVIVPCMPGFGWSQPAERPGLGAARMAVLFRNFMKRLGYDKWYVQGGDLGSQVNAHMATLYQDEVLGFHTNMPVVLTPRAILMQGLGALNPPMIVEKHQEHRMYPLMNLLSNMMEDLGFMHIQATKPETIGVSLDDSPTGLLAYILEKFSVKKQKDGGLWNYDPNWLIDNLMIYWSTKSGTTSARLYAETMNKEAMALGLEKIPTTVPTWCAQAPHEIIYQPPSIIKLKYPNLVGVTEFEAGGHFLAQGQPKEFSADVLNALEAFREFHKNGGDKKKSNLLAEAAQKAKETTEALVNNITGVTGKVVGTGKKAVEKVVDTGMDAVDKIFDVNSNLLASAKSRLHSAFAQFG